MEVLIRASNTFHLFLFFMPVLLCLNNKQTSTKWLRNGTKATFFTFVLTSLLVSVPDMDTKLYDNLLITITKWITFEESNTMSVFFFLKETKKAALVVLTQTVTVPFSQELDLPGSQAGIIEPCSTTERPTAVLTPYQETILLCNTLVGPYISHFGRREKTLKA